MAWEYLGNEEFKIRYELVRAIFNVHTLGFNNAIDINCGANASLYTYMPDMFDAYYGNDINAARDIKGGKAWLHKCDDKDIMPHVKEFLSGMVINVVILLGDGAGNLNGEVKESKTSRETFKQVVDEFNPKLVIYETVQKFINDYGVLKEVNDYLRNKEYENILSIGVIIGETGDFVNDRLFSVYKKRNVV